MHQKLIGENVLTSRWWGEQLISPVLILSLGMEQHTGDD